MGNRVLYTPLDPGFVITEEDMPAQPDSKLMEEFRSLIGSIGYCSSALPYDISYAVSALSRHLARPCKKAVDAARRVIQYLLTTRDFAIEWKSSRQSQQDQTDNVLIGAVDASFAKVSQWTLILGVHMEATSTLLITGQSAGKAGCRA